MSCEIREYVPYQTQNKDWPKKLTVTAFVGNGADKDNPRRSNIQLTIGGAYCHLTESQIIDLISVLSNRVLHRDQYTATGMTEHLYQCLPSGELQEVKD